LLTATGGMQAVVKRAGGHASDIASDIRRSRVDLALPFQADVYQEQCIRATATLGSTVWGGISHQPLHLSEKAVDDILRKELVISGAWNSSFAPFASDWENALTFMGQKKIVKGDVITHRLTLDELPGAFQMMLQRETYFNKVMFFPG